MENIFVIKTLRKNNKIKSLVSLCLGGKYFLVPARPPHSAWQEGGLVRFRFVGANERLELVKYPG